MVERVANILSYNFREIIASPLILELLSIYSTLYLHGGPTAFCEKCHSDYYQTLIKNGMETAKNYDEVQVRTLIPMWNGLYWVSKAARHFDSSTITDSEACRYLLDGQLRESDFEKLPDEWVKYKADLEAEKNQRKEEIKTPAQAPKKPAKK
jgi:hypothetical protein